MLSRLFARADWPLQKRLVVVTIALSAISLLLTATSLFVSQRFISAQSESSLASQALRNHMEGDMMHDALRSQLYQALYAKQVGDAQAMSNANKEFNANAANFRLQIANNSELDLPPEVQSAVSEVEQPLEDYVKVASDLIDRLKRNRPIAPADLKQFDLRFENLTVSMAAAGDRIEATIASSSERVKLLGMAWRAVMLLGVTGLALAIAFTWYTLRHGVVGPLESLTSVVGRLTAGDLSVEVTHGDRKDEIGSLAKGLGQFKAAVLAARAAEEQARRAEEAMHNERLADRESTLEKQRREQLNQMAEELERQVLANAQSLAEAGRALTRTADTLAGRADATRDAAGVAGRASEQGVNNAQVVAVATTQLMSAINEIGQLTGRNANSARDMAEKSCDVMTVVRAMTEAADRIGDVSALIAGIASTTNMLALNATIEAARAGESGRGFAVVANEVKMLAEQIAEATGDIGSQISTVRATADQVKTVMTDMAASIDRFDEASIAIATAIDEQGAAINEINDTVQRGASDSEAMRETIAVLERDADATQGDARTIAGAVDQIETKGEELDRAIRQFIERVRAA